MKKMMFIGVMVSLLMATTAIAAPPVKGKATHKQVNQHGRIKHGVKNGSLTRAEAARLRSQQRTIQAMKRVARADGRVTHAERVVINNAQRRASRSIYVNKHDRQYRRY